MSENWRQKIVVAAVLLLHASAWGAEIERVVVSATEGLGRGNAGAAWISARQLRESGFKGEIILAMPEDAHTRMALAQLLPQYSADASEFQALPHGIQALNMTGAESYERLGEIDAWFGPMAQGTSNGASARVTLTTGMIGRAESLGLRVADGPTTYFSGASGLSQLGHYGDPVVAQAKRERDPKAMARNVLAREAKRNPERARIYEHVSALSARDVELGVVYGVGSPATHGQFSRYLQAARKLADDRRRPVVVLSTSGLTPTEITKLTAESGTVAIDLFRGESLPAVLEPGKAYLVHSGVLPHEAYGRLLTASSLPAIVSGDSALSAALASGKPFFVTEASGYNDNALRAIPAMLRAQGGEAAAAQFENLSRSRPVDLAAMRSPESTRAFAQVSDGMHQPQILTLARIAEAVLTDAKTALEALRASGLTPARCDEVLRLTLESLK